MKTITQSFAFAVPDPSKQARWTEFAKHFRATEGFDPNPRGDRVRSLFDYWSAALSTASKP